MLDTSLEQYVGRPHNSETLAVLHLRPGGSLGNTAAAYAASPKTFAVRYHESLCMVEIEQAGTGDTRWVHSRPVRRVVGTVG